MKLYSIIWRADGYGLKRVALPARRANIYGPTLRCSYWQIWQGDRVIDRALTKKKALKRIQRLKEVQQ